MTWSWWIYKPLQYIDSIFELIIANQAKVFQVVGKADNSSRLGLNRCVLAKESEIAMLNGKARFSTHCVKNNYLWVKTSFVFTAHDGYLCLV